MKTVDVLLEITFCNICVCHDMKPCYVIGCVKLVKTMLLHVCKNVCTYKINLGFGFDKLKVENYSVENHWVFRKSIFKFDDLVC